MASRIMQIYWQIYWVEAAQSQVLYPRPEVPLPHNPAEIPSWISSTTALHRPPIQQQSRLHLPICCRHQGLQHFQSTAKTILPSPSRFREWRKELQYWPDSETPPTSID